MLANVFANFCKFCKISVKFSDSCKILNFLEFSNFSENLQYFENSASSFCRSRKMLQNEYLVAKIGVDAAENEPRKE